MPFCSPTNKSTGVGGSGAQASVPFAVATDVARQVGCRRACARKSGKDVSALGQRMRTRSQHPPTAGTQGRTGAPPVPVQHKGLNAVRRPAEGKAKARKHIQCGRHLAQHGAWALRGWPMARVAGLEFEELDKACAGCAASINRGAGL